MNVGIHDEFTFRKVLTAQLMSSACIQKLKMFGI
jgi:hypothetical protein